MSFNFKTVTLEQLKTIDGVGDATAAAITGLRDALKGNDITLEAMLVIIPEANKGPTKKALQKQLTFEKTPPQSQDARKTQPKIMEEITPVTGPIDQTQQLQMIDQRNQRRQDPEHDMRMRQRQMDTLHDKVVKGNVNESYSVLTLACMIDQQLGSKQPNTKLPVGIPKSLSYSGSESEDWEHFWRRALEFIQRHSIGGIDYQQHFLSYMLTGAAMQFYNRLCFRETPDGLHFLTRKMEARFGNKLIYENAFNQFIKMKQGEEEEVRSFMDRIQMMGEKANPGQSSKNIERQIIAIFSQGIRDSYISQQLISKNLTTISETMETYMRIRYSMQQLGRKPANSIREMTVDHDNFHINEIQTKYDMKDTLDKIAESNNALNLQMANLTASINTLVGKTEARGRSPSNNTPRSPGKKCYNCQGWGHFSSDCSSPKTTRSASPNSAAKSLKFDDPKVNELSLPSQGAL